LHYRIMVNVEQRKNEFTAEKPTIVKLVNMDDKVTQGELSDEGYTNENWKKTILTSSPMLQKIYNDVKPSMDKFRNKLQTIPVYETIEQERSKLHLFHGILTMILGGSWVGFANLWCFCVVNDVFDVVGTLMLNVTGADMEKTMKCLHQLWVYALVYYAVRTVPLLSNVTIAFMLEKYVTETIYASAIMASVEVYLPLKGTFGRWCPCVVQGLVRFFLIVLSLVSSRIQVCLVMACIGFHKVYGSLTESLREEIENFKGPFKLGGKSVMLWVCVIVTSGWQFMHEYESYFIGILVPLGFLIREKVKVI